MMISPVEHCFVQHPSRKLARRQCRAASHQQGITGHPQHQKNIFVFGLGYTSVALGNWLAADGWNVSGTCRTPARVDGLRAKGWTVDCYDPARGVGLTPELRERLECSPYVLSSVPPLGLALYDPALSAQRALLKPLAPRLTWVGYLSSTGVYGDWGGEWVDESSPCRLTSSRALVRQEAEAAWRELHGTHGLPVHVFRLGGIYGPGRSVLDTLNSRPSDMSQSQQRRGRQRYIARIHVYDICAVLAASMAAPNPGAVYNVTDADPVPRRDVVSYARALTAPSASDDGGGGGTDRGPDGSADIVPAGAARDIGDSSATSSYSTGGGTGGGDSGSGGGRGGEGADEKRVRSERILQELGVVLRYPSYREGLTGLVRGEVWPLEGGDVALLAEGRTWGRV